MIIDPFRGVFLSFWISYGMHQHNMLYLLRKDIHSCRFCCLLLWLKIQVLEECPIACGGVQTFVSIEPS